MNDIEKVPYHTHDGINSPKVKGRDLESYAILAFHPTTATWPFGEGRIAFSQVTVMGVTTYRFNCMINGEVRYEELT